MPSRVTAALALIVLIVLAVLAASASRASAQTRAASADVPVTKVVLFSSGVGYFEHAGVVHGNAATELRFKTSQINDILKSIMLLDLDGGHVGAVTYPSQDPLEKTLKSFQVDITRNPSLAQLLNQLRGARVTIQPASAAAITGTVLGVESRSKPSAQGEAVQVPVLNLLSGATIREIELQSISNLTLDDPQLQSELSKALASLVQARDQDKKPVTIDFDGVGDRRVRIGYVVETPIWKTSYRLLLGEKGTHADLQGWAIVENQTESDWNGVSLALVSGRPISFMMDLYQPLYATRPTVVPEMYAGLHPQVYDAGTSDEREHVSMAPAAAPAPKAPPAQRRIGYGADGRPIINQLSEVVTTEADFAGSQTVQSVASAGALGALFQYTVPNVTLGRQKSAMLPIITDSISAERVSIYNESVLRTNPLNGVWLTNTTGKHLLQGPVTVLEKGGYAGDARIDDVPPGQQRLLSYGIDLDITVSTVNRSNDNIVAAKIDRGVLLLSRRTVAVQEYAADNKSSKEKMLVIEHPIHAGSQLVDTQKPFETTATLYRFKGVAPANKVTTLRVTEQTVHQQSIALLSADSMMLASFSRSGAFSHDVLDALAKAARMKQDVAAVERQLDAGLQQERNITAEQNRIRENMKTVAPSGEYYQRLLAKLNEQESTIERIQTERATLTAKRASLVAALQEYLATLSVG